MQAKFYTNILYMSMILDINLYFFSNGFSERYLNSCFATFMNHCERPRILKKLYSPFLYSCSGEKILTGVEGRFLPCPPANLTSSELRSGFLLASGENPIHRSSGLVIGFYLHTRHYAIKKHNPYGLCFFMRTIFRLSTGFSPFRTPLPSQRTVFPRSRRRSRLPRRKG